MKTRISYIDYLRFVGLICVIMLHIMGNTINTFHLESNLYNILTSLLSFCIPMFIMISGSMFLNPKKDITIKTMLIKYILKILLIILIFGSLFIIIEQIYTKDINVLDIFIRLIKGNTWDHMWYLYLLLGLYLLTPIFKKLINHINEVELRYLLILLFLSSILIPEINRIFNISIAFTIPTISTYIFYYIYGYYIINKNISKDYKYISYALFVISIFLLVVLNHNYYINYSYTSPICFFLTNGIIILFKDLDFKQSDFITSVAFHSLGIYILHQLYINLIFKYFKIDFIVNSPIIGLFIYTIFIFLITYLTVYILKKIKGISKLL